MKAGNRFGMISAGLLAVLILAGAALATDKSEVPQPKSVAPAEEPCPILAEFVTPADSLSKLMYFADGKVTLNDLCPIRKVKLNPKHKAAYVNDHPVGFC